MRNSTLEVSSTTTSGENADRSGLRRSDYSEVTHVQEVILLNGERVLVPGEKMISLTTMELVTKTGSNELKSSPKSEQPKSRSSIGATVVKFLGNFLSSRSRSSQQNEEDSENLRPNIYPKEGSSKVFPGRRVNPLEINGVVIAELGHVQTIDKDVELSSTPSYKPNTKECSGSSQVSPLDQRREEILKNVI